eukprot:2297594-Rhodomonas_salina.1
MCLRLTHSGSLTQTQAHPLIVFRPPSSTRGPRPPQAGSPSKSSSSRPHCRLESKRRKICA